MGSRPRRLPTASERCKRYALSLAKMRIATLGRSVDTRSPIRPASLRCRTRANASSDPELRIGAMKVSRSADRTLCQMPTDVRVGLLAAAVCLAAFAGVIVSVVDARQKLQRAIPASFQRSIAAATDRPPRGEALGCTKLERNRYRCEGVVQTGSRASATYSYLLSWTGGRCWTANLERRAGKAKLPRSLKGCVAR
jgi:hypothetical protein